MENKLNPNFQYNRYGYSLRFVQEEDAEFILSLRTDKELSKYIHDTSNDINKQIEWTREYKKREVEGLDYYFIMSKDSIPLGVIRMYNIHDKTYTLGSLVMRRGITPEDVTAIHILVREISFEVLNFEIEDNFDGVHVDNKKVLKYVLSWGAKEYRRFMDIKGEYVSLILKKEDYLKIKPKKLKILGY